MNGRHSEFSHDMVTAIKTSIRSNKNGLKKDLRQRKDSDLISVPDIFKDMLRHRSYIITKNEWHSEFYMTCCN